MQKSFKILKDLGIKKAGDVISLEVNKEGMPLNSFWKQRFIDSKKDNCIEIIKKEKKVIKEDK